MSALTDCVIDTLVSHEVIDLYFIISDLVDIELSEAEICENAFYDAMASQAVPSTDENPATPIGKLVC